MNKVILIGNVGQTPDVKSFDWGKKASFSLATSEYRKDKDGNKVTDTEWHNIVFFGPVVDVIEKFAGKGDKVAITGKIKTRKYTDKNGQDHWATEIIGDNIELLGSKKETNSTPQEYTDNMPF